MRNRPYTYFVLYLRCLDTQLDKSIAVYTLKRIYFSSGKDFCIFEMLEWDVFINSPILDWWKPGEYLLHEGIRVNNILGMCTNNYSYRLLLLLFINMCIDPDNCNTIVEFKVVLLYTIIILRYKEGHDLNNLKD